MDCPPGVLQATRLRAARFSMSLLPPRFADADCSRFYVSTIFATETQLQQPFHGTWKLASNARQSTAPACGNAHRSLQPTGIGMVPAKPLTPIFSPCDYLLACSSTGRTIQRRAPQCTRRSSDFLLICCLRFTGWAESLEPGVSFAISLAPGILVCWTVYTDLSTCRAWKLYAVLARRCLSSGRLTSTIFMKTSCACMMLAISLAPLFFSWRFVYSQQPTVGSRPVVLLITVTL